MDRSAVEVITLLRGAGLPALLLKGASIAESLYHDGATRGYSDVDLLIASADLATAGHVLQSEGYLPQLRQGDVSEDVHAEEWLHPSRRWNLDLHTTLPGLVPADPRLWSALWSGRGVLRLASSEVDVLGPVGAAMHVALHAAHHGQASPQPRQDLGRALALHSTAVWREAAVLAKAVGGEDAFGAGLLLVDEGRQLMAEERWPHPTATRVRLRAASAPAAALALDRFVRAGSLRTAVRVLGSELAPSPAFLRHTQPLARRSRRGLVAAYVARPMLLTMRLTPAIIALRAARRPAVRTDVYGASVPESPKAL